MSGDPLYVQTDGLRSFSQTHSEVVAGLSQLMGAAAPAAAGVETTHGPIAAAVSAALSDLLGARQSTLQTTANSGNTLSELLQRAAQAYEDGDKRGASAMVSAAEAMATPTEPAEQGVLRAAQPGPVPALRMRLHQVAAERETRWAR
jgi:hypothetical protein